MAVEWDYEGAARLVSGLMNESEGRAWRRLLPVFNYLVDKWWGFR